MTHPTVVRLWEEADAEQLWARLEREFPGQGVVPVELEPGITGWLTTDYATLRQVLSDDTVFARDPRWWREMADGTIPADSPLRITWRKRQSAIFSDGEEHARLRSGLEKALEQLTQQRVFSDIQAAADELIDVFAPVGAADLIDQYARQLPLLVLCRWFGMDQATTTACADQMRLLWLMDENAAAAERRFNELLSEHVEVKAARPGDDLPSWMLANGLTHRETTDSMMLVVAVTDTPVPNLIGNTLLQVLTAGRRRGTMLIREVVNSAIWNEPPIQYLIGRYPTRDVRIGSFNLRRGDLILLGYGGATREQRRHAAATGNLHYQASNRSHLTFSAGAHQCPRAGRDHSLQLTEVAVERLLQRLDGLALDLPPQAVPRLPTAALYGLASLPVSFSPIRAAYPAARTQGGSSSWQPTPTSHQSSPSTRAASPHTTQSSKSSRPRRRWFGWLTRG